MTNAGTDETPRLLAGYRAVRRVAPPDAPWPGVLTRMPDDELCVLVDAAQLGESWSGWPFTAAAHVLAPLDVLRRPGGHDVALPVCVERVTEFVARRERADAPLTAGESVTLAVSLLRGEAALARRHPDRSSAAEWWLTDAGQPVLATERGADAEALEALLESLAASADVRLATVLRDAASSAQEQRTLLRDLEHLERRLFEAAEALPLETSVFAPLRARVIDPLRRVASDDAGEAAPHTSWFRALTGHIDSDVTELVSTVTTDAWRRLRSRPRGGRRRPWLIATGIAGAIVCVGLAWPGGSGGPATADDASQADPLTSATASPAGDPAAPAPQAVPTPTVSGAEPSAPSGWVERADAILDARQRCDQDLDCLASVVEDPGRSFPTGVIDLPEAQRSTTLLDDFGGAAVLRVDDLADSAKAQLVFVVQVDQRTLLRDVHDIAEQSD